MVTCMPGQTYCPASVIAIVAGSIAGRRATHGEFTFETSLAHAARVDRGVLGHGLDRVALDLGVAPRALQDAVHVRGDEARLRGSFAVLGAPRGARNAHGLSVGQGS